MNISSGKVMTALKVVVYGPEGIGKSSFAANFPNPVFIDTEGSTKFMDVRRFDQKPSSWQMLLQQVEYVRNNPETCETLVVDTMDWAEMLCSNSVCATYKKKSIEDFGYGKGYVFLQEEFGRLLNLLEEVIERGINVVVCAHAKMRKFEQPDEMGAYDRWEMKLTKQVAPLVKEWADIVLFANYKTFVVETEEKTKKVSGGKRVMYTTHHPCWDAKNRHNLKEVLPLDFAEIAQLFIPAARSTQAVPEVKPAAVSAEESTYQVIEDPTAGTLPFEPSKTPDMQVDVPNHLQPLYDLMQSNSVTKEELQEVVCNRGYYPPGTELTAYDPEFVSGVLVAAWSQVYELILAIRKGVPF